MTDALRKAAQKALRLMELNRMWPEVTTELRAALAAQAEQDTAATIVGHSVARGGWCVYEPDIGGEYTCLRGPFATQEEAISAQHQQATAQAEPVAQPEPKPLRRGTTGTCSRSICICDRDGLGDQCIWLRPSEPMIDGYPLMSGLPPPAHPQQATAQAEPVAFDHGIGADRYQVVKGSFWWHIRIGDGTANVGKFHSKLAAEDMALKLLTAFRDGAFMQSKAAQPQQAAAQAEPVAWRYEDSRGNYRYRGYAPGFDREYAILKPVALYLAAQPQHAAANPLTPTSSRS